MQTLTPGKSHDQIKPTLKKYNARCEALGVAEPKVVFTDNVTDRSVLEECIPALANGVVTAQPENPRRLQPASLEGIETIYVTTSTQLEQCVAIHLLPLLEVSSSDTANPLVVVALDTEWSTDSNYRKREQDKVATVQIAPASQKLVYVFNVYTLTDGFRLEFPEPLRLFLEHPSVRFVGSRVDIDIRHLKEDWDVGVRNHSNAACNLAMICKAAGWPLNGSASLQKLAEVVLGVRTVSDFTYLCTKQYMYVFYSSRLFNNVFLFPMSVPTHLGGPFSPM